MASGDKLHLKFIDAYKAAFSRKSKQKQYSDGQALWNELKSDRSKDLDKIEELLCTYVSKKKGNFNVLLAVCKTKQKTRN